MTAADSICSVVPASAELRDVESFGGSTAGAPTLASCAPHTQYLARDRASGRTTTSLSITLPTMRSPFVLAERALGTPNLASRGHQTGV